ncbi:MAG: sigma-54-dependent Fis family transcriptional regulator [Fibrobacteres bacterium]|nr:sigma-54-dependent Fis family transcriptional regulator [Fibrobacterota bacterium]
MNDIIYNAINSLKLSRLSFKRPIIPFVADKNGYIIENLTSSELNHTSHQLTIFKMLFAQQPRIQDHFEISDFRQVYDKIKSGETSQAVFPAKTSTSNKIIDFHTYSLHPTHFCQLSLLPDERILVLLFSDPVFPQIEHYETPVLFYNHSEELSAFNYPFLSLLSPSAKDPSAIFGRHLREFFIDTPQNIEQAFFKKLQPASENQETILDLNKFETTPHTVKINKHNRLEIRNNISDFGLLTWPEELPFQDHQCTIEIIYRSSSGHPPLFLFGNKGFIDTNLLTPDQAGFSIGPDAIGQRILYKRIGYLTAASLPLLENHPENTQTVHLVLGSDFFQYNINEKEVFSFWNRTPFKAQRRFLNIGIRADENIELINAKLYIAAKNAQRTDSPALRFVHMPDRYFDYTFFANPLARQATNTYRGVILHEVTELHKRIDYETRRRSELHRQLDQLTQAPAFLGNSTLLKKTVEHGISMLKTTLPLLIQGETGTGKSTLASYLHSVISAPRKPFVTMDCSTIPHELFESILFGHVRGAFTGAHNDSRGLLENANNGTVYIDEIQNLSLTDQAKLLHVLQEKKISRVGSSDQITLSLRFIISSNEDLKERVKAGTFREDLYYRICGVLLRMPPLRERLEDLPDLCAHFLKSSSRDLGRRIDGLSAECFDLLSAHNWPGNVRELQNVLIHAAIFSTGNIITLSDLQRAMEITPSASTEQIEKGIGRISKKQFTTSLKNNRGQVIKVAKELGVTRHTVYYNLKRFGLILSDFR